MSKQLLVIVLGVICLVGRRWLEMVAESFASRVVQWWIRVAAPRLTLIILLAAERIAPAGGQVAVDIAGILVDHAEQEETGGLDEDHVLPFKWSLLLLARASIALVGVIGTTFNATLGTVAFSYTTVWAALWALGHRVPMKTTSGYTEAAWIYTIPINCLAIFALVMVCVTFAAFAGLKWDPRRWWRVALEEPRSGREVTGRGVRLVGAVTVVALLDRVLQCPPTMLLYGVLGTVLLAVCHQHLGVRLSLVSASVGGAAGTASLLLLETQQNLAAWTVTALLLVPIARITAARVRADVVSEEGLPA